MTGLVGGYEISEDFIELLGQELNCGDRDLIWVFMKLAVEVWMVVRIHAMVVRIHAALENLSIHGSVKKACRDPQRADMITVCPSFTYPLDFDIATVSSKLRGDRSLRETAANLRDLRSSISISMDGSPVASRFRSDLRGPVANIYPASPDGSGRPNGESARARLYSW